LVLAGKIHSYLKKVGVKIHDVLEAKKSLKWLRGLTAHMLGFHFSVIDSSNLS
jgi:hypothetical protein